MMPLARKLLAHTVLCKISNGETWWKKQNKNLIEVNLGENIGFLQALGMTKPTSYYFVFSCMETGEACVFKYSYLIACSLDARYFYSLLSFLITYPTATSLVIVASQEIQSLIFSPFNLN